MSVCARFLVHDTLLRQKITDTDKQGHFLGPVFVCVHVVGVIIYTLIISEQKNS